MVMPLNLYVFSGLPASGKTTLSKRLANKLEAVYLRIDTIEQALRDLCGLEVQAEGYRLAYRIAGDNLQLGNNVVADSCNPIELTRREWEGVAHAEGANAVNIEVVCSDQTEHRLRVDTRAACPTNLTLPTWAEIVSREYEPWKTPRIVLDTAQATPEQSFGALCELLGLS